MDALQLQVAFEVPLADPEEFVFEHSVDHSLILQAKRVVHNFSPVNEMINPLTFLIRFAISFGLFGP